MLAAEAPELREALERASDAGFLHVILDGKIIPSDRCKEPVISVKGEVIDLWYSGKAHVHGGNVQAVLAPGGFPLWVSDVQPGSVHDLTAARTHALPALYRAAAADLPTLADPRYDGAGIGVLIPVKQPAGGQELDINTRTRNALQRSLRCLGERGFALLTGRWRTLQHITASPSKTATSPAPPSSSPISSTATSHEIRSDISLCQVGHLEEVRTIQVSEPVFEATYSYIQSPVSEPVAGQPVKIPDFQAARPEWWEVSACRLISVVALELTKVNHFKNRGSVSGRM